MYGGATPPGGGYVCEEGAFGGERCGSVQATDISPPALVSEPLVPSGREYCKYMDEINTGNGDIGGDSGATEWETSIFGNLVTGTNVSASSTSVFGEDIQALLYVYSVYYGSALVVNTPSNP